ncbi:MAG: cation transporter [Verrucomicrobia bacterium]|nr:MAG: cation transporter [Verrucomicrobiota bacterium]
MRRTRLQRGLRVILVAMAVNLSLAATKLAAGIWGHSNALIGDAVESLTDLLSSLIVWRGLAVAAAPPDKEHPYGHGKAEPLAAAAVAMMLLFAAVGIALQAGHALFNRHEPPEAFTLWVLGAVIVVKELLYRFALREAEIMESSAVRSDAWHHRSDAITSLAAAVGIGVALVGGPRWAAADDVAALVAAAVVGFNGWRLLRPALHELMDAAPDEDDRRRLRELAGEVEGVQRVEKCLVRKAGVQWFVELHIEVDAGMTVARAHAIAHAVEDHLQACLPAVADVLVHVEPYEPGFRS